MGVGDFFRDKLGSLQGKQKVRLVVEFNQENMREHEVKAALHPHDVVAAKKKGAHTWRVDIRTHKEQDDLIAEIAKHQNVIRNVTAAGKD